MTSCHDRLQLGRARVSILTNTKMKIKILRDDTIPAYGAWCAGSLKDGESTMLLNVEACLSDSVDESGNDVASTPIEKKWLVITTLMHEFGHALQEYFNLEFTEEEIEKIVSEYESMPKSEIT